jgi:hypothetical protein
MSSETVAHKHRKCRLKLPMAEDFPKGISKRFKKINLGH